MKVYRVRKAEGVTDKLTIGFFDSLRDAAEVAKEWNSAYLDRVVVDEITVFYFKTDYDQHLKDVRRLAAIRKLSDEDIESLHLNSVKESIYQHDTDIIKKVINYEGIDD